VAPFVHTGFEPPAAGGFHDWRTTRDELRSLGTSFPGTTRYRSIGTTCEGLEIPSLTIAAAVARPRRILIVGCHHAREWISVEIPLAFANRIAGSLAPEVERPLLGHFEFTIVPMLNPDGHTYSTTPENRMWRKNRSLGDDYGVDLNRNYSANWGKGLTSSSASSDMFKGEAAFSERETSAARDLFVELRPDLLLSYHSYGEEILHPWAFDPFSSKDPTLQAGQELSRAYAAGTGKLGDAYATRSLRDHYGEGIGVGGDMCDWATIESRGDCLSLTIELSPRTGNPGFALPSSAIPNVVAQNWAGLIELLQLHRVIRP
jgi:carboxypeptidase T